MRPLSVLLLNLPIPEFYNGIQRGSTRLFSDYIESVLAVKSIRNIKVLKPDRFEIESYNNNALLDLILKLKPDAVGFSNYLWNIQRNIQIALKLKEHGIITIAGGPEINEYNGFIKDKKCFDFMIEGEGEYALIDILIKLSGNEKNIPAFTKKCPYADFNDFIAKYEKLTDDYKYDGLFYFEIERGCPYKCIYCAYGKNRNSITSIREDLFDSLTDSIMNKDIKEIYLLSPTFNRNRDAFISRLKKIIQLKKIYRKEIKLFAELRPELIKDDDIKLLQNAGFKEIEFGVQTLNTDSHGILNRNSGKFDLKDFVKKLSDSGIAPLIDFIIGLPGESMDDILRYIEYLDKHDILQFSQFYQLHVLSNTSIRNIFDKNNYGYLKEPPYFAMSTDALNYNDIKSIYYYLENDKKLSYFHDFFDFRQDNFYILKNINGIETFLKNKYYHSASFVFIDNFTNEMIINIFKEFFKNSPEIFHISYIYSEKGYDKAFLNALNNAFNEHKNFYDAFTDNINYNTDHIMSKTFYLMFDPSQAGFDEAYDDHLKGFVVFPDQIKRTDKYYKILSDYHENESIYTYLFNENRGINADFTRIFPSDHN